MRSLIEKKRKERKRERRESSERRGISRELECSALSVERKRGSFSSQMRGHSEEAMFRLTRSCGGAHVEFSLVGMKTAMF